MKRVGTVLFVIACMTGCGKVPTPDSGTATTPTNTPVKSTVETVVDGMTGKTAIEAGTRAKARIREIGTKEQHDRDEALQP